MKRFLLAALAALALALGIVAPAQASTIYVTNPFVVHLTCSAYDQSQLNTYTFGLDLALYESNVDHGDTNQLHLQTYYLSSGTASEKWNTDPAFGANRVQVTLEESPSAFVELTGATLGGSSSTLNDVAGSGTANNYSYLPYQYNATFKPRLHLVVWGVGAGSSTATCGQFVTIPTETFYST